MRNVSSIERLARVVGGGVLAGFGLAFLMRGGGTPWVRAVDVTMVALGIDFLITGATGRCPLYRWLGWSSVRPRKH